MTRDELMAMAIRDAYEQPSSLERAALLLELAREMRLGESHPPQTTPKRAATGTQRRHDRGDGGRGHA